MAEEIAPKAISVKTIAGSLRFTLPSTLVFNLFSWKGPLGAHVVLARAETEDEQVFGFGADFDLTRACEKAYFELVSPSIWLSTPHELRAKLEIDRDSLLNPDHFRDAHRLKTESYLTPLLDAGGNKAPEIDSHLKAYDFFWGQVEPVSCLGSNISISIVKAVCPKLQALFFSHWQDADLNPISIDRARVSSLGLHAIP